MARLNINRIVVGKEHKISLRQITLYGEKMNLDITIVSTLILWQCAKQNYAPARQCAQVL